MAPETSTTQVKETAVVVKKAVSFKGEDSLLNTVLTQEPTTFPAENKTLIDEAIESEQTFSEKLNEVADNVNRYNVRDLLEIVANR